MHSRVVQRVPAVRKLVAQTRHGVPQQRHGASDMWSSHRCATEICIGAIAGIGGRARARAGSADIRLYPVASIGCHRAAAAKASYRVGAGVQRAGRVSRLVNSGRILYG